MLEKFQLLDVWIIMTTENSSDTYYEYFSCNQNELMKCAPPKVGVIQSDEYNAIQDNIGTIYPPRMANAARSSFLACSASS
jgi:hypothetical protein